MSARILDAKARVLVTADGVWRGKKLIHLLEVADTALNLVKVKNTLYLKFGQDQIEKNPEEFSKANNALQKAIIYYRFELTFCSDV